MEPLIWFACAICIIVCIFALYYLVISIIIVLEKHKEQKDRKNLSERPIFGTLSITIDSENKILYPFVEFNSEKSARELLNAKEATFTVEVINPNLRKKNNL